MSPSVTAVIPCHNHVKWVWNAIESVATQQYDNKKIIVVDDGSTDGSHEEILRRLYKPKPGIADQLKGKPDIWLGKIPNNGTELLVIRYPEASGPSFARNRGIEIAAPATHFFAFLDSDDYYEQGKIQKSVDIFMTNPKIIGAVYSDYETIRPDGLKIREFKEPFSRKRLVRECMVNCDSLVSLEALRVCDGFDEQMRVAEDYDLWMRISERFVIYHIPEHLLTIRVGQHSSTSTVSKETWNKCWHRVMQKAEQRANQNA